VVRAEISAAGKVLDFNERYYIPGGRGVGWKNIEVEEELLYFFSRM
jgi:hypothetical protein